jgi:GNAT superfamily N-acetyltransferase
MTTTLRPVGPERREPDGTRARTYTVCVNSRPVGGVELGTDRRYGPTVGRINALAIDAPDRGRGRGTVAALAAEEVLRQWGCTRVETAVPAAADHALRMAAALGYTERNRTMRLDLDGSPSGAHHPLPAGSTLRPLRDDEYDDWRAHEREGFIASLTSRGVPHEQALAHEASAYAYALPDGPATPGTELLVLEHEGTVVGHLWLRTTDPGWVFSIEVLAGHRGHGHGRALMLAAADRTRDAGARTLQLNVFAGNTPALTLYESLGFRPIDHHFHKPLL